MTLESSGGRAITMSFLAHFPPVVRQALTDIHIDKTFREGEFLCRENERIDDIYLIVSGRVGLDMFVPGRGQVRIQTLADGELLAWSAVVGDQMATATATAIADTVAMAFPADALLDLCQTNHEAGYLIMRQLAKTISRRLVTTRLQLLDLFAEQST